ncbi:hypothetical protein HK100_010304 [Physocladia obscura]|uniref:Uncharacterized protein n=1 Tax=Physocladia obscura TaxID=109957 RepID=A0AAD5XHM1_9FUNG|nr:hypothetical protein HK100_010304 [Physocladia obscura]
MFSNLLDLLHNGSMDFTNLWESNEVKHNPINLDSEKNFAHDFGNSNTHIRTVNALNDFPYSANITTVLKKRLLYATFKVKQGWENESINRVVELTNDKYAKISPAAKRKADLVVVTTTKKNANCSRSHAVGVAMKRKIYEMSNGRKENNGNAIPKELPGSASHAAKKTLNTFIENGDESTRFIETRERSKSLILNEDVRHEKISSKATIGQIKFKYSLSPQFDWLVCHPPKFSLLLSPQFRLLPICLNQSPQFRNYQHQGETQLHYRKYCSKPHPIANSTPKDNTNINLTFNRTRRTLIHHRYLQTNHSQFQVQYNTIRFPIIIIRSS